MQMKMIDSLSPVSAGIDHNAITRINESLLSSDVGSSPQEGAQINGVISMLQRLDVLPRYNEDMSWCSRADVTKRDCVVVLHDNVRGNLAFRDATKETVF